MEGEEGYTALQFKGRRKPLDEEEYSSLQVNRRSKPEDEDGYTAMHYHNRRKPEDIHEDVLTGNTKTSHWLRRLLFISGALNVLLLLSGILLGVLVLKYSQKVAALSPASDKQCENRTLFNQETADWTGAGPGCERCPKDWLLHGKICYYFSKDKEVKTWSWSHEDCSSRSSRMLVIKDQAELVQDNRHQ
ncbi:killer cell lectin-like receptor subfamily B member 1B allele C [Pleurodeles waltl]|uniref:killer cell lectin-like receptor subfamily B member 1B allele C n=1 Tax=Pleurodeles waltl TaxID=8319 RepID=UPI0037095368